MAHKVIVPQKKIMSRSFLNSGTIIVKSETHFFHLEFAGQHMPYDASGKGGRKPANYYFLLSNILFWSVDN